jgi:lipoprotein
MRLGFIGLLGLLLGGGLGCWGRLVRFAPAASNQGYGHEEQREG